MEADENSGQTASIFKEMILHIQQHLVGFLGTRKTECGCTKAHTYVYTLCTHTFEEFRFKDAEEEDLLKGFFTFAPP